MARYKHYDYGQMKMLPISFERQILAGTFDTERGRHEYARRLAIVEPVFANIGHARGLKRFSLRGAAKVNTQWMLYCLVHNIGKVQKYGAIGEPSIKSSEMRH